MLVRLAGSMVLTLSIVLLAAPLGCSGGDVGVCGNGITERSEECDCGGNPNNLPAECYGINGELNSSCSINCELREVHFTKVILNWTINGESFLQPGQSFDTCNDVDATFVRVLLEGPGGYTAEDPSAHCTSHLVEFRDDSAASPLLPGAYHAWLQIETGEGTPLAPQVQVDLDVFEGIDNQATVNFPLEDFYDYDNLRGEFGVRLYWGADTVGCDGAMPPVVDRVLTLTQDGSPLAGYPQGDACEDASLFTGDLLPGDYQLLVQGYDNLASLEYCEQFDVKVGAGIQPAYYLVVPVTDASATCPP